MKNLLFVLFMVVSFAANAKDIKYPVIAIPEDLKENASTVIRNEEIIYTIDEGFKATKEEKKAITVLNKNGFDDAILVFFYDKFSKVTSISGKIYDEYGNEVDKIKNSEIKDYSAVSGFSLYEDNRVKYYEPKVRIYPFTIEYEVTIKYDGVFNLPVWHVFKGYNVSVEKSRYKVVAPHSMDIKYLEQNLSDKVLIKNTKDGMFYEWTHKNFEAIENEPFNNYELEYTPAVYVKSTKFALDGIEGNMDTWESFGKWLAILNKDANNLPEETTKEVKALASIYPEEKDKVNAVYKYMQNKTRYVSIQIGIGGWKPFDAETVDRTGYGDCKALTNYTRSLLEAAGINSYYAVVRAGTNAPPMVKEFAMNQFNHAILYVPLKNDTVWLECTSQFNPFGYLSTFTDDRDVMIINDDGEGEIIHTKIYGIEDNVQTRYASVKVDQGGSANASVETKYAGTLYRKGATYSIQPEEKAEKELYKNLELSNFKINDFEYETINEHEPCIKENLDLIISGYARTMGNRLFLTPNLLNRVSNVPKNDDDRKADIFIRRSYAEYDTVVYHLPSGFQPEAVPEDIYITSPFGEYSSKCMFDGGQLIYVRSFKMFKGQHPPSTYADLQAFYKQAYKADNSKMVLIKN